MLPIPPSPNILEIGPLALRWYGLLIVLGVLLAAIIAAREAKRRGLDPNIVWDGLFVVLIFGLVGARLYHVVSTPTGSEIGFQYYLQNPIEIFAIWRGGLGIYGAVVGGVIGLYLFTRWRRLNFLQYLDVGTPGLLLAQAIGRWGNYFNQELYGFPTDLPWGIPIDLQHRLPQFAQLPADTLFHPSFLYESLWNFAGFWVLLYVARRFGQRLLNGEIFGLYLILYSLGRFLVEFQRPDAWMMGGLATAQWIAIALILLSLGIMLYRRRVRGEVHGVVSAPEPPRPPQRRKGRFLERRARKNVER